MHGFGGPFVDERRLTDDEIRTIVRWGSLLASQRRFEDAVAEFRKAIDVRPDHSETHNNLGVVLKALGRVDEAIAAFRKAVAIDPTNAAAKQNLTETLRHK